MAMGENYKMIQLSPTFTTSTKSSPSTPTLPPAVPQRTPQQLRKNNGGNNNNNPELLLMSEKINQATSHKKRLQHQIDQERKKYKDSNLIDVAKNVPKIINSWGPLKLQQTLKGHFKKISKIQWAKTNNLNEQSRYLLSGSQDGFLIIWDTWLNHKIDAIVLESQWILDCCFSPSGQFVASSGLDNICTIYNVTNGSHYNKVSQEVNQSNSMNNNLISKEQYEMTSNGHYLKRTPIAMLKGHSCYISRCEFIDDRQILTASGDMTCGLWDIAKGKRIRQFTDHLGDVLSLSLTPTIDKNIFLSGASDGQVRVWDLRSNKVTQMFDNGNSDVNTLEFLPAGEGFMTGSEDGILRLFDLRSDCLLQQYTLPNTYYNKGSPGGDSRSKRVSGTGSLSSYSTFSMSTSRSPSSRFSTVSAVSSESESRTSVNALGLSKSGRLAFVSYDQLGVLVWDILHSEVVGTVKGHNNVVSSIACAQDGVSVATGCWDTTVKVWTS